MWNGKCASSSGRALIAGLAFGVLVGEVAAVGAQHHDVTGRREVLLQAVLAALPARGARLHAAPPPWSGVGTWPVRAYALVPGDTRS